MITITIFGLDQFVVGRLSRELTPNIAKIYETSEDNINFMAPSVMVFHNGVEQTSWNVLVRVHAPKKVSVLQDLAKDVLIKGILGPTINVAVEFYYYSQDDRYEYINPDYPHFLTEANVVNTEDIDNYDDSHDDLEEGEGEDEIFTGDIFEGIKRK